MLAKTLDQLLTTLDIALHAFALCEVQGGHRLVFDPMEAVVVHYVLAGMGVVRLTNGGEAALQPDRLVIVPPQLGQVLEAAGADGESARVVFADEHCVALEAGGLVRFVAGEAPPGLLVACGTISASYGSGFGLFDALSVPLAADAAELDGAEAAFRLLLAELSNPRVGTRALTQALMTQCLVLLLRRELARDGGSPLFAALREPRLARVVLRVLDQPAAPHSLTSMAALAGMNRSSFAERFPLVYGESPLGFVQRVRLRHAATLLGTTDLPVKVVAASVGYASRSHFSRSFRVAYGMDPRTYRQTKVESDAASGGHPAAARNEE